MVNMRAYSEWDEYYKKYPLDELGWELGKPRPLLVELVKSGVIKIGVALDLCCGAGTNTVYLAQKGFEVSGIDISKTALGMVKQKTKLVRVDIAFLKGSFVDLAFADSIFDFVFDMGCFHHVKVDDRDRFIAGLNRVLKLDGQYMITCFSYKNGPGWNHFTKQQIIDLFSGYFNIDSIRHISSLEGDGVIRFFYTALMHKKR